MTPAQETQVVTMYNETGVTVKEIARVFGICRKTVYNVLGRARKSA